MTVKCRQDGSYNVEKYFVKLPQVHVGGKKIENFVDLKFMKSGNVDCMRTIQ